MALMNMTSTLSSRFQGALWGAAIADFSAPLLDSVWGKLVVCGCQQLIQQGTLRLPLLPIAQPGEVTGLILPISLYFHEDLDSLVDRWRAIASHYQLSSDWYTQGLLIAISLSALVEGSIAPEDLIAYGRSLFAHFNDPALDNCPPDSPLIQGLQTFVKSSHSFSGAIALAQKTPQQPSLSCRIAATLCGTHQTRLGIPLPWQVFLENKIQDPQTPWPHGIKPLNTLSANLLASWSGADWVKA